MRGSIGSLLVLSLAVVAPPPAAAEALVQCMGDSITLGNEPFDEEGRGGYPRRMQPLLREGGLKGAIVENHGRSGETTAEALARLGAVLDSAADAFIFLEGTNDVDRIRGGRLLIDDTIANIDTLLRRVESAGVRPIVGTLIPRRPGVRVDSSNRTTYELVLRIRELARARRHELADFWHAFPNREDSTFALYYYTGFDNVGHPNAAGFQRMAEVAAGVVLPGDSQSPVEGRFRSPGQVEEVDDSTDYEIDLFDFDSGVFLPSATFAMNGEEIPTEVTGNSGKPTLIAEDDGRRRCKVVLSVRASDRADPPNQLDFYIATYKVKGQTLIGGDGTGDCRVDGRDLGRFGPLFGKLETDPGFDAEFDFVADGMIDGQDLARLAANFGKGSL